MADIMPRCETCKFWLAPSENHWADDFQPTEHSSLSGGPDVARDVTWGVCGMTVFGWHAGPGYAYLRPDSLAVAHDHEQYAAELLTQPMFGCVQHEPKEDQ